MIDTHCHIQFQSFKDNYQEVLDRCVAKKTAIIAVGTQKSTSKKAVEFADKYDNIYAAIGLHPIHTGSAEVDEEEDSFLSRDEDFDFEYYKELAKNKKVVAVGECGLELFHLPKDKSREEILEKQKKVFDKQITFSKDTGLPLIIHIREAHKETVEFLKQYSGLKGVVHCYTSGWENAKAYLDMGFYLGFTGIITFPPKKTDPKPQHDLLEVVEKTPMDRILVETDSPYLAPQAYRGKQCEPWMVEEVVKKIAEIKGLSFEEVEKQTDSNALSLFGTKAIN